MRMDDRDTVRTLGRLINALAGTIGYEFEIESTRRAGEAAPVLVNVRIGFNQVDRLSEILEAHLDAQEAG